MKNQHSSVIFTELNTSNRKKVAIAELNAPKSLNALSLPMIKSLTEQLLAWQENEDIAVIILKGLGGKAFCAGGDVVSLYHHLKDNSFPISDAKIKQSLAFDFFHSEYQLDQLIHAYRKPILVWADGYVMGGGIGLMAGASHRVVSEKTLMAMPEVTIGLYPDVGASWFLNKMPSNIGLFLGLTGSMFNGVDAQTLCLADYIVNSECYDKIQRELLDVIWESNESNHQLLSDLLNEFMLEKESLPEALIVKHQNSIVEMTSFDNIDKIYHAIVGANIEYDNKWLKQAQQKILNGSPLSIALVYQQLQRSKTFTLKECFDSELNLSLRCCQQKEFSEGVRALLVDKDKSPQWQYKNITDIDNNVVEWFFYPLDLNHKNKEHTLDRENK
ncbi:MAG: enoyl-CoA hydratase/carnithine racemase [Alteromonadaceae bacterium]|jgi:enoyl-CoA hydratase/carnithine racemase